MQKRAVEFFDGVAKRVTSAYADLWQTASVLAPKQAALILGFDVPVESTYLAFPEPIGCNNVPRGKEQEACNLVKELLNLDARYQKEKALLVGVRMINAQQLLMFITGDKQVQLDNKEINAEECVQNLYAAYASPDFNMQRIYELEALAAPHLLREDESVTLAHYDSLTYNAQKEYAYDLDQVTHEENLNKAAMLEIMKEKAKTALTVEQQNNIKQRMAFLAAMMNFAKEKAKVQIGFMDRETQARAELIAAEDATSKTMVASFAPAAPLVQKVRMFTEDDNLLLNNINRILQDIANIQDAGFTAVGNYKVINEGIMDYASDKFIKPDARKNVEKLLENQFTRRVIAVPDMASFKVRLPYKNILADIQNFAKNLDWKYMPNGDRLQEADFAGFHAVAAALDVWVDDMHLEFPEKERKNIKIVLLKMSTSDPQDMSNNYLKFIYSLWKMRALYNYYDNWRDQVEKDKFLDAIKTAAHQNFMHVSDQFNQQLGHLRCLNGAKGRSFLVDISMLEFFRDKHPEFAVN